MSFKNRKDSTGNKLVGAIGLASVLALTAGTAAAQSNVMISGVIDSSVEFVNTGDSNATTDKRISSGGGSASRLVFSGSETLSNDLSVIFNLDSAFFGDTGATFNPAIAPTGLFGRRAVVGLTSKTYGGITLGRDYTPVFIAAVKTDIALFKYYGNVGSFSKIAAPRANNGIFYTSPTWSGFTMRAHYSMGIESSASPRDEGRQIGIGGEYANGPFFLSAGYQTLAVKKPAAPTTSENLKEGSLGGKYTFGDFTLNGGYFFVDPIGGSNEIKSIYGGLLYRFGGKNRVGVQLGRTETDAAAGTKPRLSTFAFHYGYDISKRTELYVNYAHGSNNSTSKALIGGNIGPINVTPTQFGSDPWALAFGVSHAF